MSDLKLFKEIPKSADFHSVVMTTFSFDFYHFESQVLRELKAIGVTNVNVFVDTSMLDKNIGFSTGHLKSLSTSYSINSIPCNGAFHPKITILAGENDILLLQGSGNITNGGHGKNHELFTVFYANREDQTQLPIIQEAWLYFRRLTNKIEGISSEKIDWLSSNCNLLKDIRITPHQFCEIDTNFSAALLYNEETSIWQQLKALITPSKVKEIKVFSPFYDEKGTLLKQLAAEYNNCIIDAYLQPGRGIHPFQMEEMSGIRFISWESTDRAKEKTVKYLRKLHSKLFWFDMGEVQYCLIGSANATIKAFGTEAKRGINDEFAILIKVSDKHILSDLKLTGVVEFITPTENIDEQIAEKEIENDQTRATSKIKLLGVDQDGMNVFVYILNDTKLKSSTLTFYDQWGNELDWITIDVTQPKIKVELADTIKDKKIAYVQLTDSENLSLSNKQVVNQLHELWNTNPSAENRKLMKLSSLIESGNGGVFDIVEFYNTIQSSSNLSMKTSSNGLERYKGTQNEREPSAASLTYEEAIALDKETTEHQKILRQHSSIRIWDSLEKYLKDLALKEQDEDMDDEEEGEATASRIRSEKNERLFSIPLNSMKVLERRRSSIEFFLSNYITVLKKGADSRSNQIGLVDMAMFLIVMKHLIQFTNRKIVFKESEDNSYESILYPIKGKLSSLNNFSGATLNILGAFVNLLCCAQIENSRDEYSRNKLIHYQDLVKRSSIFSLAIIIEIYQDHNNGKKWADLLAYNIIDKCGDLEVGFEKHLSEFLRNSSIDGIQEDSLIERIETWRAKSKDHGYFRAENLGICNVVKRIPAEGAVKFLKLSRPGFEFDEEKKDFILSQLYNFKTHELQSSLQDLKKNGIDRS